MKNPAQFNVSHLNNVSCENTLCHIFLPYVKKLPFKKNFSSKISPDHSDLTCSFISQIWSVFFGLFLLDECDDGRSIWNFLLFFYMLTTWGRSCFNIYVVFCDHGRMYLTSFVSSSWVAVVYFCTVDLCDLRRRVYPGRICLCLHCRWLRPWSQCRPGSQ